MIYIVCGSVLLSIIFEQQQMKGTSRQRKVFEAIATWVGFNIVVYLYLQRYPLSSKTMLNILVLAYLCISGYVDMKTSKVPIYYGATFIPLFCIQHFFSQLRNVSFLELFLVISICLCGKFIKNVIGIGDIYIFSILSLLCGFVYSLTVLSMGLFFLGLYAVISVMVKGILIQTKIRIAFSPFIGMSYIVLLFLGNN